jgi:hypothetical protein
VCFRVFCLHSWGRCFLKDVREPTRAVKDDGGRWLVGGKRHTMLLGYRGVRGDTTVATPARHGRPYKRDLIR